MSLKPHDHLHIIRLLLIVHILMDLILFPFNAVKATESFSLPDQPSIEALLADAEGLLENKQFQDALELYQAVLLRCQQEQNQQQAGEIAVTLGSLYSARGHYEEAIRYFKRAIDIFQQLGNRQDEAMALIYTGNTHAEWSRYDRAFDTLQQALQLSREIPDRAGEWSALKSLGDVLLKLGRFKEALERYSEALHITKIDQACRSYLTLITSIGSAYTALGRYREAILQNEQALTMLREAACDDLQDNEREKSILHAEILLSSRITYLQIGDYARTIALLEEALAIFRNTHHAWGEGTALSMLGGIYEERGEYFTALRMYEQALTIQRTGPDVMGRIMTLNNSAKAWFRFCQATSNHALQHAIPLYNEALEEARSAGAQTVEARILNNLGEVYLELSRTSETPDDVNQAFFYFQKALRIQHTLHDSASEWMTLVNLGHLHETQNNLHEALSYYEEAVEILEEITTFSRIEEVTISLRGQAADLYQRAVLLLVRLGRDEAAFHMSERARARAFLDQLGNQHVTFRNTADAPDIEHEQRIRSELAEIERELSQELQKSPEAQNPQHLHFLEIQREKQRQAYAGLRIRLQASHPDYHRLTTIEPLTLAQIQSSLTRDMTLLSYIVACKQTVAFVITRQSLHTFLLPIGEQELTPLVHAARQPAERHHAPPPALHTLYQELITPLAAHLKTPLLGIVPHGVLHYLPFAALTDAGRYLHDDYTLFFLPGASAIAFFKGRVNSAQDTILALANSKAQGLPNLPCAAQEVQALATFYPRYYRTFSLFGSTNHSPDVCLHQDNTPFICATETALKTLAPAYSIVHLAAHGELNVANPLFSRILLVPDDHNDGALEVHEIYELSLDRTELVVLSACDTQLGQLSQGDDLIGLTRAFMYAGAPSVIASLWKVDDQATRDFMVAFYFFLKHSPTKADALRAAQRLIRAKYPHPYYWAAFILTGDPGR